MIKVLIVEDSRTVSQYLEYILSSDLEIEVIGNVANGQMAVDFVKKTKPDIISMDIDMPIMNGLEATREIMTTIPVPIIVVTASRNAHNVNISIEALAAGALTVIDKPLGIGHPNEPIKTKKLISTIKVYSDVKVIKRKYISKKTTTAKKTLKPVNKDKTPRVDINNLLNKNYVAIGISSGGPQVLSEIFSKISENFPYPILVVQHITEGFLGSMILWLNRLLLIPVHIASDKEKLLAGHIYFAPDNFQMGVNFNRITLYNYEPKLRICPSVEYLFKSLEQNHPKKVIAMLLTGMGKDGAKELKALRYTGALTIAQDEESSLVHGMPGEAIKLDGADYILNPNQISNTLLEIEKTSKKQNN